MSSFIQDLLCKDVNSRLGCRAGFEEIKNHALFTKHQVNWENVLNKTDCPPHVGVSSDLDFNLSDAQGEVGEMKMNFESDFCYESVDRFNGFEYYR